MQGLGKFSRPGREGRIGADIRPMIPDDDWTTEVGKNVGRIAGAPNRDLSTGAFPME